MKKFLMVLLAVAMMVAGGVVAFAATGEEYSQEDIDAVTRILGDCGLSLGDDPAQWNFVTWSEYRGEMRITELSLTGLNLTGELKISGQLPRLENLFCSFNSLTSLNVSDCTELFNLNCNGNSLTFLSVSSCAKLGFIDCSSNSLTSLNLSGCTELGILDCSYNSLESLDVSSCTELYELNCSHNALTSLNVTGTKLIDLYCSYNSLSFLDVSGDWLSKLDCAWNNLISLDVTYCPNLNHLLCTYNMMPNEDAVIGFRNIGITFEFIPQKDIEDDDNAGNTGDTGDGDDNGGSTGSTGSSGQTSKKYKVYRGGGEEVFTNSLENLLGPNSSLYNSRLAHLLMSMCWSVKDETEITKTFESFGFASGDVLTNYSMSEIVEAFGMAKKKVGNQTVVLVVLRGTEDTLEMIDNGVGYLYLIDGQQSGFRRASDKIYDKIVSSDFLGTTDLSNVRFVLTGFSRGAAVANILAARLADEGIQSRNLYAYTFACPDLVKSTSELRTKYTNIFNIANARDLISWVPGSLKGFSDDWTKYGQSYWFYDNWSDYENLQMTNVLNFFDEIHREDNYWSYLQKERALSTMKTRSGAMAALDDAKEWRRKQDAQSNLGAGLFTLLGIHCPVDLEVYAADGTLAATVIDNVPDILSEESLYIYVDGSEKNIFFLDNGEYTVKFIPTSDGYMDYTVQNVDIDTWTISGEKIYKTVAIIKDQNLVSYVNVEDKTDTSAVRLYILNDDGEPGEEILPGDNSPSNNGATSKSTAKEEKDSNSYNYQAEQEALKAIKAANAGKSTSRVQTYPTAAGADVPAVTVKLYGWGAGLSLETMRTLAEGTTGLRVNLNNGAAYVLIPAGFTMPNIPGVLGYNLAYQKDPWQSSLMKALVKDPDAITETHLLGGGELPTAATVTLKTGLTGTVNVYHWDPTTRRVTFLAAGSAESGRVTFATKQLGNLILTDGTI